VEQRRVVARIEELAAQIHEARTLRHRAAEEAEALFSNSRDKIFSRVEGTSSMELSELGEVARFRTGYAFKSIDYRPSGRLIFSVSNISADGSIDRTDSVFLADELESDYDDYQLRAGDILMVMVGGSVGKLCMIPESVLPALMNQNMWRINPLSVDELSAEYLYHFLHRCNRTLGVGLTQSTHGHLTQTEYRSQKIPLPPLAEQRRIVAELDALQAGVDALKRLQAETSAELDALLPSILDKAFKGEL
jgi:type I restriction enzyme S subunit